MNIIIVGYQKVFKHMQYSIQFFIKVGLSPSKKKFFASMIALQKWWKMFISSLKLFSFSRYLNFCRLFGHVEKTAWLKNKVNYEIHDVTAWLTNYNTHISQYLPNQRQPDNKIWSVNRILQEKYFTSKIMQKMRQGDYSVTSFCFLKKSYIR